MRADINTHKPPNDQYQELQINEKKRNNPVEKWMSRIDFSMKRKTFPLT